MARTERLIEIFAAAGLAVVAFVISPPGISLLTGRGDLPFRINAVSLVIDLFLVAVSAALLTRGRARGACFYAVACAFPLALLGGLEAAAIYVRLADRIAPLEDTSLLANLGRWPGYLMSNARRQTDVGGAPLYRPWRGDGIVINDLGLRTAPPRPKEPGEWRIAITGGSTVWGTRVLDADTIPSRLQDILRQERGGGVTVYNFGTEAAKLDDELLVLKHFRDIYAIDQVLFYTGGNDAFFSYLEAVNSRAGPWAGNAATFELVKLVARLYAIWRDPSTQTLKRLDGEVIPQAMRAQSLRKSTAAADDLCRAAVLRCDFVLQPMLFWRKSLSGPEVRLAATLGRVYPRIDVLASRMYGDVLASGPAGRVHDLSNAFDSDKAPYFTDFIHLSEAGNRAIAEQLARIVAPGLKH